MTVSAHFIRLLACNIASYHSLAPLALNSVCTFDSVCVRVCLITMYIALLSHYSLIGIVDCAAC